MFINFKKRVVKYCFLAVLFIALGIFLSYKVFSLQKRYENRNITPNISNSSIKHLTEESVVNKIRNTQKFLPLETELSEDIIIDNSWGDSEVFKKIKRIQYFGTASYSLDLSSFDKSNVNMDKRNNKVSLTLEKPKINSIHLINDKTLYETTSNGSLRFGEIKLSPEELNNIETEVLKRMEEKINGISFVTLAEKNSKTILENIIHSLTETDMKVEVTFK